MRIYLDTNILLDLVSANRDEEVKKDAAIVEYYARLNGFPLFMSVISVPTVFYLLKGLPEQERKMKVGNLVARVGVLPSGMSDVEAALASDFKDFEDGLQYECARQGNCDLIITRNKKDFSLSEIPVVTPKEFLAEIYSPVTTISQLRQSK